MICFGVVYPHCTLDEIIAFCFTIEGWIHSSISCTERLIKVRVSFVEAVDEI
mgnify:FL=1